MGLPAKNCEAQENEAVGNKIPAVCMPVEKKQGDATCKIDNTPQVSMLQKVAYGAVSFATHSLHIFINAFGNDFYVQMGALLPIISLFTALGRSLDIVTDLTMAWYSDNFHSKYGRRRPFMALGCIPYGIMFFLLFSPPSNIGAVGISLYYGTFYTLFYLADTVSTVPYDALGPELSSNYKERNTIFFTNRLFQTLGCIVASTMPAIWASFLSARGWSQIAVSRASNAVTAAFFGIWYIISTFLCVATIQERPQAEQNSAPQTPLVPSLLRGFRNPAVKALILAWIMDGLQCAVTVTMFPFYIRYYIQPDGPAAHSRGLAFVPETFIGINITLFFISAALSSPVWLFLSHHLGKFESWMLYNIVSAASNLLFLLPHEGQTKLVMIVMFISGLHSGGMFLNNSIMADVIDYEELLHGVRSEGAFGVFATLVNKTVAIPGSAIPLGILSLLGFVSPIDGVEQEQPKAVVNFLYLSLTVFSVCCSLVSILSKMNFPIKKRETVAAIQAGVKELADGQESTDPITGNAIHRTQLNTKETELYWLLENFGQSGWEIIATSSGDASPLVLRARMQIFASLCFSCCTAGAAFCSLFFLLSDPHLSIFATVGAICAAFSLYWLFVSICGWRDAKKLSCTSNDELLCVVRKLLRCSDMPHREGKSSSQC